jgi:hypothetical protein
VEEKKEKKEKIEEKKEKKEKRELSKKAPILLILAAVVVAAVILGGIFYRKAKGLVVGNIFSRLTGGVVDVDKDGEKVTITSEEGEFSFEEGGSLPDNFPSDFPIYPDAKLASSWTASGDDTDGLSLIWETEDSVSKVSNYYEGELEDAGWTLSFTSETEDSTTFAFEKNDASGFIGITVEESKTVISLTLGL